MSASSSLLRQIIRLALPVALQSALVSTLSMVDVIMISTLGSTEIAAVGLGAKIHFVAIMIMASLGTGCSVMIAQYWGTRDIRGTQRIIALGGSIGVLLLLPLTLAFYAVPQWFVSLASADPELLQLGGNYLKITAPLLILTHLIIIYESGMRAMAQPQLALWTSAAAIGINILLNYMLILGNFGAPALGVDGAAWGTVLARLLQLAIVFSVLQLRRHPLWFDWLSTLRQIPLALVKRYLHISWPLVVNFTVWGSGTFVYNIIAGQMGTESLAILTVLSPVESMAFALVFGLSSAGGVLLGHHLGRDEFSDAKQLANRFMLLMPLTALLLAGLLMLGRPWVMMMFGDLQPETWHQAEQIYLLMCIGLLLKASNNMMIQGVMRTGGDNRYCLYTDMLAMWVITIPLCWIAAFYWQLDYRWIYGLMLIEELTKIVLNTPRIRAGHWLRNLTSLGSDSDTAEQETPVAA